MICLEGSKTVIKLIETIFPPFRLPGYLLLPGHILITPYIVFLSLH